MPRALVANDDGIDSPGPSALAVAAHAAGLDVVVVANTLSPTPSRATIGVSSRASNRLATNAISAAPAASAR